MSVVFKCVNFHEPSRKNIEKIVDIQEKAEKNPKVVEYGYDSVSVFDWMYEKATGKYFDMTKPVSDGDVKLFDREWTKFQKDWGANQSWFTSLFKTPQRLASKNPKLAKMVDNIRSAYSYRESHLKTNQKYAHNAIKSIKNMIKLKGDKKENKRLTELEKKVSQGGVDHQENIDNLMNYIHKFENRDEPTFIRGSKLLDGTELPKNQIEDELIRNWSQIRNESVKTQLNSFNNIRSMIGTLGDGRMKSGLVRLLDRVNELQNQMMKQTENDKRELRYDQDQIPYWYDPVTKKTTAFEGRETPKADLKYMPRYVIEMVNIQNEIVSTFEAVKKNPTDQSILERMITFEKEISTGNLLKRSKARDMKSEYLYSVDPVFYMNKYIQDVAHHNFSTRINNELHKVLKGFGDHLFEVESGKRAPDEFTEMAQYVANTLIPELQNSIHSINNKGTLENFVRTINAMEYSMKIGLNPRSALKNFTQKLFNLNHWGAGIYRLSRNFYNEDKNSSWTQNVSNGDRWLNQVERFDVHYGRNITAKLEGSFDPNVVPPGYTYDPVKGLQKGVESTVSETIARGAQKIAEKAGVLHGWVETKNRNGTFKLSFAYNFELMQKHRDYFSDRWMERRKSDKQPTDQQLDNYIEYLAGNAAYRDMTKLHFDYNNWAKAKILRGKPGRVFGQFMHYTFQQFDLHHEYVKDMLVHGMHGKFEGSKIGFFSGKIEDAMFGQEMRRPMRLLSLYGSVGMAGAFLDLNLSGIIQNDVYDRAKQFLEYYWSDPTKDPGFGETNKLMNSQSETMNRLYAKRAKEENISKEVAELDALADKYRKTFGKPLWANYLGPAMSDTLMLGDLFDFWNMTPDSVQKRLNLYKDPNNPDWWYNIFRIFHTAGARWAQSTGPTFMKHGFLPALRSELSFYNPTQDHIGWWGKKLGYEPHKRDEYASKALYNMGYKGKYLPLIKPKESVKKLDKKARLLQILSKLG